MVTAIVLINAKANKTSELARFLADLQGVSEVFSVAGRYDLVAVIGVKDNEELPEVVSAKIRQLEGIERTETLIAFRSYSSTELKAGYSMGLD